MANECIANQNYICQEEAMIKIKKPLSDYQLQSQELFAVFIRYPTFYNYFKSNNKNQSNGIKDDVPIAIVKINFN